MGDRAEQVSIARLKPAQVDPTKSVQLQPPVRRGCPPGLPGPPSATETDNTQGQPLAQTHQTTHITYGATNVTASALSVTVRCLCWGELKQAMKVHPKQSRSILDLDAFI
ncbi:hypothetical protein PoB_006773400 [Plakobranchus ocellatus]|uniref:Uncharacterized protein n=1 Tax=Plakobranchus ocellatus TaxID=259542 RepID=A0AAV4DAG5_9GAST|nr:hypothetical protein PoB_006773400 [Plakobranchus ocellatus]